MGRRILFTILSLFFVAGQSFAQSQSGELKGRVLDANTKEPVPFANVVVESGGMQRGGTTTDLDGYYTIKPIPPGTYDVRATYVGYNPSLTRGVSIHANHIQQLNIELQSGIVFEDEVVIIEKRWEKPLIEVDNTTSGGRVTSTEMDQMATRSVNSMIGTVAGAYSKEGGTPHVRGGRQDATEYYIDGVRVRGRLAIPQNAIAQLEVITGGVPAEFGDAIGGFINITTKGPSSKFFGGVEGITSEIFDPYGYNVLEGNISGPLLFKDRKSEQPDTVIIGFFLSGSFQSLRDQRPSPVGAWKIREDRLQYIQENPLAPAPSGSGFVSNADFVTMEDLENVKLRQNVGERNGSISGKLDFQPHHNINITTGGQVGLQNVRDYIHSYSLFNYNNNSETVRNSYRGYVRFTQNFRPATEEQARNAKIKNAYYSIQADYSKNFISRYEHKHRENLFDYGHIGTFERYRRPTYTSDGNISYQSGYTDTLITFTPSGKNPVTENYTKQYFNLVDNRVFNYNQITQNRGLLNGGSPEIIYSLWQGIGSPYPWYQIFDQEQFNLFATASGTVNNHSLKFGVQFEQQVDRSWVVNAAGLWGVMRQHMNFHIGQVDDQNPQLVFDDKGMFQDTINYPTLISPDNQRAIDRNFREYLKSIGATDVYGKPIDDHSLINVDRYDPGMFDISMFGPNELLQYGDAASQPFSYYGYTHDGKKLKGRTSIEDFIDPDKRYIGAYNPIYVAGFIEDKFAFRDLIFRLGLRVDRFDANQPVLRDKYSLYPTRTVVETHDELDHPSSMGDNFVVYVDDTYSPTKRVIGYRDGDRWYNAQGVEVIDPRFLATQSATGQIQPYLQAQTSDDEEIKAESFKDYEPRINLMPRISFSFPISEEAAFFANYDVLTQRPRTGIIGSYDDYYRMVFRSTRRINNPALQPEQRTNYELGFKQKISGNSAITLQAFYGEIKNMVQVVQVYQAYPIDYTTYGNVDFGTVKGFNLTYDMRRDPRTNLAFQTTYTLQFADGTGSSATSAANLITAGQPNLLVPVPLSYDVRHNIVSVIDFRFGGGELYNGPVTGGGTKIFENTGVNFLLNTRSGEPYTRQGNITQAVAIGVRQSTSLDGNIHGSRLPWQFRADMKIDRDFNMAFGRRDNPDAQTAGQTGSGNLNVYIWVSNLFNTQNVINVYRYTGSPSDDGWLTSTEGVLAANRQTNAAAYYDQYSVKVNDPANYALPRFIRLGARLNF